MSCDKENDLPKVAIICDIAHCNSAFAHHEAYLRAVEAMDGVIIVQDGKAIQGELPKKHELNNTFLDTTKLSALQVGRIELTNQIGYDDRINITYDKKHKPNTFSKNFKKQLSNKNRNK